MTKREALEKSLEMWTWLMEQALQGNYYEKHKWFKETGNSRVACFCFLCAYAESNNYTCENCLIKQWSKYVHPSVYGCSCKGSPYLQWSQGMSLIQHQNYGIYAKRDVVEGAVGMVNLLEKALLQLKIEELQEEIGNLKRGNENDR